MTPKPTGSLLVLLVGLAATGFAVGGVYLYRQRTHTRQELEVLKELSRARDLGSVTSVKPLSQTFPTATASTSSSQTYGTKLHPKRHQGRRV